MERVTLMGEKIPKYLLITFVWLSIVYARVQHHLGGIIMIGTGYLLLFLTVSPGVIRIKRERFELIHVIKWLLIFVVIYIVGMNFLGSKTGRQVILGFNIERESFNIIKNIPIWLAFLIIQGKEHEWEKDSRLVVIYLLVDMMFTLYTLSVFPDFSRLMATGELPTNMKPYRINGAMGYELVYSVVLLVPMLLLKGIKSKSPLYLIGFAISFVLICRSSYMLAVVLMFVNLVLVLEDLVSNKALRLVIKVSSCILIFVLLINREIIGTALIALARVVESNVLSLRLGDLGRMILFSDMTGESLGRLDLYTNDLINALKSPLIGMAIFDPSYTSSGHSTILGIWSVLGFVGLIPFVQMLCHMYAYTVADIEDRMIRGCIRSAYVTFFLMATLNPVFAAPHIMTCMLWIIPVLAKGTMKQRVTIAKM